MPPAGAIFGRVLSLRPPTTVLLVAAGGDVAVVTVDVVGLVVVGDESWSITVCHSPDVVLKKI